MKIKTLGAAAAGGFPMSGGDDIAKETQAAVQLPRLSEPDGRAVLRET